MIVIIFTVIGLDFTQEWAIPYHAVTVRRSQFFFRSSSQCHMLRAKEKCDEK